MNKESFIKAVLWLTAIAGAIFIFSIEFYNRLSIDDYHFASILKDQNVFTFAETMYFERGGMYFSWIISGLIIKSILLFDSVLPVGILLYVLNILFIFLSLKNFMGENIANLFQISAILFQLYIYSMLGIESYFWVCCKPYTLIMSLTLYGFSVIYSERKNWRIYISILFCFTVAGNAYSIFSPLILASLGLLYLFLLFNKNQSDAESQKRSKVLFAIIVCFCALIIFLISPANWARMRLTYYDRPDGVKELVLISVGSIFQIVKLLFFRSYYFLLAIPLLYEFTSPYYDKFKFSKKTLIFSLSALIIFGGSSVILNSYAVGGSLALRAFNFVNYLFFYFLAIFSYFLLFQNHFFQKYRSPILVLSLLCVLLINILNIIWNIPGTKIYADSDKNRIKYLIQLNAEGNTKAIHLDPLKVYPYESLEAIIGRKLIPTYSRNTIIMPNEISIDTSFVFNQDLKNYYQLNYNIYSDIDLEPKRYNK